MPQNGATPAPGYIASTTLTATVAATDGKPHVVTWTSSDNALATVNSNGQVQTTTTSTGGTLTITATSADDTRFFATASITVVAAGTVELGVN